jgi:hypothetical protein
MAVITVIMFVQGIKLRACLKYQRINRNQETEGLRANSGTFSTNEISRFTVTGTTILYISSIKIMTEEFFTTQM